MWVYKIVDASYWNSFNLQALWNLGVRVLVLRASSGATYRDPKFDQVYKDAKAIGFYVLAYHVMHPYYSAQANVANFVAATNGYELDGPPVLDCELTGGQTWSVVHLRVREAFFLLKSLYGMVINYTRKYWFDYLPGDQSWAKQFPLWVASYWNTLAGWLWPTATQVTTTIPNAYVGELAFMWQFSEKGYHISVSTGNIDKNVGTQRFADTLVTPEESIPDSGICVSLYELDISKGYGPYKAGYFGRLFVGARVYFYQKAISPDGIVWFRIAPELWIPVRGSAGWNVRVE